MSAFFFYEIATKPWLIAQSYLDAMMPYIIGIARGEKNHDWGAKRADMRPSYVSTNGQHLGLSSTRRSSNIVIIKLEGALTKRDKPSGGLGTSSMSEIIKRMDADPSVDGIMIKADSPGGMVDGTHTLAESIAAVKKPLITFVDDGMLASAAYYATASKPIYSSNALNQIGSIGVVVSFADVRGKLEKEGIKLHTIYADQSSEKNAEIKNALEGDYSTLKENILNPAADQFINFVKEKRELITDENVFKGAIFSSDKAVLNGLIDGIRNYDGALIELLNLIEMEGQDNNGIDLSALNKRMDEMQSQIDSSASDLKEQGILLNEKDELLKAQAVEIEELKKEPAGSFTNPILTASPQDAENGYIDHGDGWYTIIKTGLKHRPNPLMVASWKAANANK